MSIFLCKSILSRRNLAQTFTPIAYHHNTLRWLSNRPNEHSFTVSYLINSLGFSYKSALSASKRVSFKTSHKPDKAIEFLRNFGFTQTQISKLVRGLPQILVASCERTILPKLEFLESKGISRPELTKSLSTFPTVLSSSLHNQIMPSFEYLRTLFPSEAKTTVAVKRCPDILVVDFEKYILPNVATLQSHRVPDSSVAKFIHGWPRVVCLRPDWFRETVEEVAEMGFNPARISFLIAVCAKSYRSKWESKVCHYKQLGWSENDISRAFLKYPWCMTISTDKITSVMDFFVSEMDLKPIELADCPITFSFSLKKRVVPRIKVFRALVSKGLLKKKCTIYSLVAPIEKLFLQRYVTPFVNAAPELMKMYEGEKEIGSFSSKTIELPKFGSV